MIEEPPGSPDGDRSFPALNRYLDDLHAGRPTDRARLLAEHPELAAALDCLDALDRLAPGRDDESTLLYPTDVGSADGPPAPLGIENYEIGEELGRGGMGVVFKAWQKDLGRQVAIKMILDSHIGSRDHVARFRDEMRAAAGLEHPNIIRIYGAGHAHGQPYFAMQYIAGPSLAAVAQAGPLPPERAARLVAAVARGVAHLHSRGFVHRDLKPSNILLDEHDHPYVTDFGLVKILQGDSQKTTTGVILGTPSYMAPEQAAGRTREVGPAADVYSLGAILFELLTGRPPFCAETPLDTLVQVLEGEPPRPRVLNPRIPPDLETICLKCIEKAPEARYPSAEALAVDLERYLSGEAIEARRAGPLLRLHRWSRREPALASRLAVVAVCCAVIQINYSLGGQVDRDLHLVVMAGFVVWGLASLGFQWLLRRRQDPGWVPYGWAAADAVLLTGLLLLDGALDKPFVIAFPALVAASGLWFRVPVVWFTTVLALLGYAAVVANHLLHGGVIRAPHQHIIYAVGLTLVGFVVGYQVKRVRALSRYYENRPLPR